MTNKKAKSTPPFQSKLNPYTRQILSAWREPQTLRQIQEWLLSKNVRIKLPGLSKFIRCRLRRPNPHEFSQNQLKFAPIQIDQLAKIYLKIENKPLYAWWRD